MGNQIDASSRDGKKNVSAADWMKKVTMREPDKNISADREEERRRVSLQLENARRGARTEPHVMTVR